MSDKKILIVGAGLCGSLLALRLGQRGYQVDVYERRPDLRNETLDAGRSINLALSSRGLKALAAANIKEQVRNICIPMKGRMIHTNGHEDRFSPYSGRSDEYINSISRPGLNALLLDEADQFDNVSIHFEHKCEAVDVKAGTITVQDLNTQITTTHVGEIVIGTDGSGSVVRKSMMKHTNQLLFNYSQSFLTHGYKELSILPDENGECKIEKNALHIWPRTSHMIIALPNLDNSFTVTMFHPYDGEVGFDSIDSDDKITQMFEKEYPDLIPLMPHYLKEYNENPTSNLGTIKCSPWQAFGKSILMGDAAHAIVPFYGQGMNASLEDVFVFDQLMDTYGEDWERLFNAFQESRIPNANAIADLALDNFYEMRDHVDDPTFIHKRALEMKLEQNFDDYHSKYSLVTFNDGIGYEHAMLRGRAQDQLLKEICKKDPNPNLENVMAQIRKIKV